MSQLVSVVIPTHGRPAYLARALQSVFDQTLSEVEIIVVDDNAGDEHTRSRTVETVEGMRVACPAGSVLSLETPDGRLGGGAARNYGASRANGTYLAFLDDDDWWSPEKLEKQLGAFEGRPDYEPGIAYTSRRIVDGNGVTKRLREATHEGWIRDVLLRENVIGTTSCVMIPKAVFEAVGGFDPSLSARQDVDLFVRIAESHRVVAVTEALTVQQEHNEGRISRNFEAKADGLRKFLAKHRASIARRPAVLAAHYRRIGRHYLKYGRLVRGRYYLLRAAVVEPSVSDVLRVVVGVPRRDRGNAESEKSD